MPRIAAGDPDAARRAAEDHIAFVERALKAVGETLAREANAARRLAKYERAATRTARLVTAPAHPMATAAAKPRVGLFVTCLVDLFRPSIGFAALKLLEDAGCVVEVPEAQTCCGQPAYNSGDRGDAKAVAKGVIAAFAALRLCRRALRLLHRHDQETLSGALRRRSGMFAARRGACREDF